jgi:hypothetical protein
MCEPECNLSRFTTGNLQRLRNKPFTSINQGVFDGIRQKMVIRQAVNCDSKGAVFSSVVNVTIAYKKMIHISA